jgi:hypothetical protein
VLALNFTLAMGTSSTPRYVSQISFDILSVTSGSVGLQ